MKLMHYKRKKEEGLEERNLLYSQVPELGVAIYTMQSHGEASPKYWSGGGKWEQGKSVDQSLYWGFPEERQVRAE